jgi:hypothetical protein
MEDHVTTPAVLPRERPVRDARGESPGPLLIVVGGVPGAGKSTLLARVADDVPRTVVLDPDRYRRRIAARLPSWVPYGTYRWAVHTLHAVETLARLARGPRSTAPLLVHDTATRVRRREALGLIARLRGWDPVLVAVDVSLAEALDGQLDGAAGGVRAALGAVDGAALGARGGRRRSAWPVVERVPDGAL